MQEKPSMSPQNPQKPARPGHRLGTETAAQRELPKSQRETAHGSRCEALRCIDASFGKQKKPLSQKPTAPG
ncbi:hypothetical protein VTH06DRAFT_4258 [Thermothelomyces fergusii]